MVRLLAIILLLLTANLSIAQETDFQPDLSPERLYWDGGENCIHIVEYIDFECPYCQRSYPVLAKLINSPNHNICLYIKHLPLNSGHEFAYFLSAHYEAIRIQDSEAASRFHDLLFSELEAPYRHPLFSSMSDDEWRAASDAFVQEVYERVSSFGISSEQVALDWVSSEVQNTIEGDVREAIQLGAAETPFFWVEGQIYRGFHDLDAWLEILADAHSRRNNE